METKPITVQGVKEMLKKELSNKLESCEIDNTKDLCEFIDICMSSFHDAELPSEHDFNTKMFNVSFDIDEHTTRHIYEIGFNDCAKYVIDYIKSKRK